MNTPVFVLGAVMLLAASFGSDFTSLACDAATSTPTVSGDAGGP